ncbi:hypothetical protein BGZ82_005284 [Podila clonocystis]|nr:hypothetical protein BGZ82_005284 [Podila clonocystis]
MEGIAENIEPWMWVVTVTSDPSINPILCRDSSGRFWNASVMTLGNTASLYIWTDARPLGRPVPNLQRAPYRSARVCLPHKTDSKIVPATVMDHAVGFSFKTMDIVVNNHLEFGVVFSQREAFDPHAVIMDAITSGIPGAVLNLLEQFFPDPRPALEQHPTFTSHNSTRHMSRETTSTPDLVTSPQAAARPNTGEPTTPTALEPTSPITLEPTTPDFPEPHTPGARPLYIPCALQALEARLKESHSPYFHVALQPPQESRLSVHAAPQPPRENLSPYFPILMEEPRETQPLYVHIAPQAPQEARLPFPIAQATKETHAPTLNKTRSTSAPSASTRLETPPSVAMATTSQEISPSPSDTYRDSQSQSAEDIAGYSTASLEGKDMVFVFKAKNGNRIGLWTDQRVLVCHAKFSSLLDYLPSVPCHSSRGGHHRSVKVVTVSNSSLESYCALIQYIYLGDVKIAISPGKFALACPPGHNICSACRQGRNSTQDSSASSLADEECSVARCVVRTMKPSTTWRELFLVADMYGLEPLRRTCRDKIMTYLQPGRVLPSLFEYGFRYPDLRKMMVLYVVQHRREMWDRYGEDLLKLFEDHSECEAIRREVAIETDRF